MPYMLSGLLSSSNLQPQKLFRKVYRTRTEVCGFFYAQFYPRNGFLFISYLVANEKSAISRKETTRAIGEYLKLELDRTLQRCRAVVFELNRTT